MAYVIAQPCIGVKDTGCISVCPVDAIHPTKSEAEFAAAEQLFIDPDLCIDCSLCAAECPVSAIFSESDLPPEWNHFIAKNADYFKGPLPE
jgi:ferredoxin